MQPEIIALIALLVIIMAGVLIWIGARRRSERLRRRFGPEYDRMVETAGRRRQAESELARRESRRAELDIRPLDRETRDEFARQWRDTQARFVDEPGPAVEDGDRLVGDVMRTRGYPVEDFQQREADLSVDHPLVLRHYRAAHGISIAYLHGEASTEDLRQAMIHYRALFEELLEGEGDGHVAVVDLRDDQVRRAPPGA